MTTSNNSSQTNSNTFQGDGYSHALNYYQLVLTKGDRVLLGSQIFANWGQVEQLTRDINEGGEDIKYVVNYVSAIPNLGHLNNNLQRNYATYTGSYNTHYTNPTTYPIPDPQLDTSPEGTDSTVAGSYAVNPTVAGSYSEVPVTPPSTGGSSTGNDTPSPLPNKSYFSTPRKSSRLNNLEVVGEGIKLKYEDDGWDHLGSELSNMVDNLVDNDEEDKYSDSPPGLFDDMTLEEYGKGFLLRPPTDHPDIGTKYYHNAWWRHALSGWFLKSEYLDYFLDNGALWNLDEDTTAYEEPNVVEPNVAEPNVVEPNVAESNVVYNTEDISMGPFEDMTMEEYGKGFILRPPSAHPDFGTKYYHNAWWRSDLSAWFLKSDQLDYFLDNGAMWNLEKIDVTKGYIDSNKIFNDMIFEPYGDSGFLLQCYNNHPHYMKKTFHGGFWHRQGDGWYFSADMRNFLEDNGATFEYNEEILFDGMTFHNGVTNGQFYLSPGMYSKYYGLNGFESAAWYHEYEAWLFEGMDSKFFIDRGAMFVETF